MVKAPPLFRAGPVLEVTVAEIYEHSSNETKQTHG